MGTRVGLLGRLRLEVGDGRAGDRDLPGSQARLVLAALVLERNRPLSRDELAGIVWADRLPGTWDSALRNLVSRVRRFLAAGGLDPAAALRFEAGCYRLVLHADAVVDVEEADRLVARAGERLLAGEAAEAAEAAVAVRELLVAPFLPGVGSEWSDRVRDRLAELAVRAGEHEAEARLELGEHAAAVVAAEAVVDAAPLHETGHRLLMRALDASGNRAEALRAYERCRRILVEELGVDPSPDTEAAYLALLGAAATPPAPSEVPGRPSGTLTFLFSDIEGSSGLWERDPEAAAEALQLHDDLLRATMQAHGGRIFKHTGDGVASVFAAARDALGAAVDAQRSLLIAQWPTPVPVLVRIGLHTGEAQQRGDDYAGVALSRAARLCDLARGGQVLASSSTRLVVEGRLPAGVELRDLGDVELRGMSGGEPVYEVQHPDLPTGFPGLAATARRRLPVAVDDGPLIGRARELAAIEGALDDHQVVTVAGFGGVGKTRLAADVANQAAANRDERVVWVELAGADDASVLQTVVDAAGTARQGIALEESAVEAFAGFPTLLVVDNCEHVIPAVRRLLDALLPHCADLRVLATSRVPLGLRAETVVPIEPLGVPSEGAAFVEIAGSPAVELFFRRARSAAPGFDLTTENAGAIAEICRRLDGLPLALALAAARVRSLAPAQIAGYLDERFRLLRRGQGDGDGRQRSLDEAVRWSYQLLPEADRRLFDRVAVFADSFDLEAAVAVGGDDGAGELDVLDGLDALAERSMLRVVDDGGAVRYRLLETLRDYGRLALADGPERDTVADRHRRYHRQLVAAGAAGLRGAEEGRWVARLQAALPDIRTALATATADGDLDTCLGMVVDLFDLGLYRMRRDIGLWALDAVAVPGAAGHPQYGDAAAVAGYLAWERGDLATASAWTATALEAGGGWLAYDAHGTISLFQGRVGEAIEGWEQAAERAAAAGDATRESIARGQVAFGLVFADDAERAVEVAREAKALAATTGNPTAAAHTAWALGVALFDGEAAAALAELELALALARSVDNRMSAGAALVPAEELRTKLAHRSRHTDLQAAIERLEYWIGSGHSPNLWSTVRRIGRTLAEVGEHRAAAFAFGAEAAAPLKLPLRERERRRHEALVALVRDAIGEDAFAAEAARAAGLDLDRLLTELRAAVDQAARRAEVATGTD